MASIQGRCRAAWWRVGFVAGVFALLLAGQGAAASFATTLREDFESYALGSVWTEGTGTGGWLSEFDGYGEISVAGDGSHFLSLRPEAPTDATVTHAALVVSSRSFGDLDLRLRERTSAQLRSAPNPWEVAWVLWHYSDNKHFYFLLLKPTGWELGKEDPGYPGVQRFMATGDAPTFPTGPWYDVRVHQVGATIKIWVNGVFLVRYIDRAEPYLAGRVGLYTEDAESHFDDVQVVGTGSATGYRGSSPRGEARAG